jgi:hypothetical protein
MKLVISFGILLNAHLLISQALPVADSAKFVHKPMDDEVVQNNLAPPCEGAGPDVTLSICPYEFGDLGIGTFIPNFNYNGYWLPPLPAWPPMGSYSSCIHGEGDYQYVVAEQGCPNDTMTVTIEFVGWNPCGWHDLMFVECFSEGNPNDPTDDTLLLTIPPIPGFHNGSTYSIVTYYATIIPGTGNYDSTSTFLINPDSCIQGCYFEVAIIDDDTDCYYYDWVFGTGSSFSIDCDDPCPPLNATSLITNTTCYTSSNGAINITPPNNGTPPYTYAWSNGANTEDVSNLGVGTYSLTITDGSACASTFSFNVTSPSQILISIASVPITCNGASNGALSATSSGGVPGYSYLWSTGATTSTIQNLAAGVYSVTVTDANSCSVNSSFNLTQPAELTIGMTFQNVSCYGASNGIATAIPAGGTGGFTFLWSNGGSTSVISNVPPATYSVTVTDTNGCTNTNVVTISEPPLLALTTTSQNVTCYGAMDGTATVAPSGGSPGYSYIWSNGGSGGSISNLNPGTYSVTVTDTHACTKTASVVITGPTAIVLALSGYDVSCFGETDGWVNAEVSGGVAGYMYLWSNGMTMDSIGNLPEGNYGLTITDASGCTLSSAYEVSGPEPLELSVNTTDVSVPGGMDGSAVAEVDGGTPNYSYEWSTGENTNTISNLPAGNYSVTVTDAHECSQETSFTINQPGCGIAVQVTTASVSCFGGNDGSATADYSGGSGSPEFIWSTGDNSQMISNLTAGTYFVTVTEEDCSAFGFATINEPLPVVAQLISTPTSCNDSTGSVQLIASGGTGTLMYLWSNGEITPSIENLSQGLYTVTIADVNACTQVQNTVVIAIDTESPVQLQNADTLFLNADGGIDDYTSLQNDFMDGCGDFTFQIVNPDNIGCTNAAPDTMEIMVSDFSGNDTIYEVIITLVDTISPRIITCPPNIEQGSCQGPVYFEVPYAMDNCQLDTFYQTAGLPPGVEFPVGITLNEWVATDISGNTAVCSLWVTITEGIVLQANVHPISCRNQNDASITIDTSNIMPPFSILWSTGDSTQVLHDLAEGNYSVTLTDVNDCQAIDTFQIINPEYLSVALLGVQDVTTPDSSNGFIIISVYGGTPPYTFTWLRNDTIVSTAQNPTNLSAGTYMIILTDAHNCAFVGNEVIIGITSGISDPANPVISIYPNPVSDVMRIVSDRIIDTYKVVNLNGRTILSGSIGANSWKIDMSKEVPGIYFMMLNCNGNLTAIKFIISNY